MSGIRNIVLASFTLSLITTSAVAQWLVPKTLQEGRSRLVAVSANNKVYFAGGYNGSSVSNKIDVYDNATGDLAPYSKNLTVGRADMTAVWNENRNKIYFAGGQTNGSKSSVIEVLNLATNNFESQLALPQPIAYMCSASFGDKILFAGGSDGSTYMDKVYVYNTLTGGSPDVFTLSEARDQISVTVVGSKAIMAGGHKGGGVYSDNVDISILQPTIWCSDIRTYFPKAERSWPQPQMTQKLFSAVDKKLPAIQAQLSWMSLISLNHPAKSGR